MPIEDYPGLPGGWRITKSFESENGNCRYIPEEVKPAPVQVMRLCEYQEKPGLETLTRAIESYKGLGK